MNQHPHSRVLATSLLSVLLFACDASSPDEDQALDAAPQTAEQHATTPQDASTPDATTNKPAQAVRVERDINKPFWFGGWKVTLGKATVDPAEGTLSIAATFESLIENQLRVYSTAVSGNISISAGGKFWDQAGSEFPQLRGLGSAPGKLVFSVPQGFDIDSATIIIGEADETDAYVPLGPRGEKYVSLEPMNKTLNQTFEAGFFTVTVKTLSVMAMGGDAMPLAKGKRAIALTADLVYNESPTGFRPSAVLGGDDIWLKLPDGTEVGGHSPVELMYPGNKRTVYWWFTVPENVGGIYTLQFDLDDQAGALPIEITNAGL